MRAKLIHYHFAQVTPFDLARFLLLFHRYVPLFDSNPRFDNQNAVAGFGHLKGCYRLLSISILLLMPRRRLISCSQKVAWQCEGDT